MLSSLGLSLTSTGVSSENAPAGMNMESSGTIGLTGAIKWGPCPMGARLRGGDISMPELMIRSGKFIL